jgi:lysozyme
MIGRYGKNEPIIKGKGTYTIWQQSQKGKISGISKNVDIDVFHRKVSVTDIILVKNEE